MDVASYIREYLFKQDFLDIPGLGTFFLTKEPFSIQDSNQVIKPGSKTLIFRENSGISNDTLSYFIARRAGISVDQAREMVRGFVSPVRQLFLSRGNIEIPGLGQFSVPDGFHLDFRPYPFNFSPSSFGLGNVALNQFDETPVLISEQKSSADTQFNLPVYSPETSVKKESDGLPEYTQHEQIITASDSHAVILDQNDPAPEHAVETDFIPVSSEGPVHEHALEELELPPNEVVNSWEIHQPISVQSQDQAELGSNLEKDISKDIQHQQQTTQPDDDGHLPTAEEIYRKYGFKKEEHSNDQPANQDNSATKIVNDDKPSDNALLSGSSFSEIPVFSTGVDQAVSYPGTLAFSQEPVNLINELEQTDHSDTHTNQAIHAENEQLEAEKKDLIYNPLAYDSHLTKNKPVESVQPIPDDLGPIQELTGQDHSGYIKNEQRESSSVYWILGSILLFCMLAGFGYLEREPISQAIDNSGLFGQTNQTKPVVKTDSSSVATQNAATNLNDSINHAQIKGQDKTTAIPSISSDTTKTQLSVNSSTPDSVMISLDYAPHFLLIDASFHLLKTSKGRQKQLLGAGKHAHIIDMGAGVLMRYKVSLGEYNEKTEADAALNAEKATGHSHLQIFENKSKKN